MVAAKVTLRLLLDITVALISSRFLVRGLCNLEVTILYRVLRDMLYDEKVN